MLYVHNSSFSAPTIQTTNAGRPASGQGLSLTPTVGSKSAWATVFSSATHDIYGLVVCINNNFGSAASRATVVDIGIGAAGTEIVIIPNIIGGNAASYTTSGGGFWYYFPVFIPAGTRVAARSQSSVTTGFQVWIQAFQQPSDPASFKRAGKIEAIGITAPNGIDVTAGTTAVGAWTLLGTTTQPNWFWQIGAQIAVADTTHGQNAYHLDLAQGDGTNFNLLVKNAFFVATTAEQNALLLSVFGCEYPVPSGASIYARAWCHGTTPDIINIAAYGVGY